MGEGPLAGTDGQDALPRGLPSADLTGEKAAPQAIQQTVWAVRPCSLHPHYSALPLLCENSHTQHATRGLCYIPGKLPLENLGAHSQNRQRLLMPHAQLSLSKPPAFTPLLTPRWATSHLSQVTAWPSAFLLSSPVQICTPTHSDCAEHPRSLQTSPRNAAALRAGKGREGILPWNRQEPALPTP